ncbi:MAG: hypothetical protein O3B47_01185 [bacterium]|nr:hypothetical protein [bacterium]
MQKTCKQCGSGFQIPQEDMEFYKRIAVKVGDKKIEMPSPTLCFACRHQKRLAFRNEMFLYHRKCDHSGKQIISMYSPDKPYQIYDQHIWWSDDWDPFEYGQEFDFSRPFFEQYRELQLKVPRMSVNNINAENSDYCNLSLNDKNCYLVFTADDNEDCAYGRFFDRNYRSFDCDYTYDSIDCYECMDMAKCNGCSYSHKCVNSSGLFLCYNMIGCHDCIGSANLRNKQHYIFNESYTPEEYEKKKADMALSTHSGLENARKQYEESLEKQPRKYLEIVNCEDSLGDYLRDCKNAQYCYNGFGLEDCKYMINCWKAKDCYDWDFVGATGSELCHEMGSSAYNMVNCHFCNGCWENCSEIYYAELCLNSKNLFGCISLRHKQYCILNKQYSREEYEELLPRIIEHMKNSGEWGEFFPIELSTFAYNETVAAEYFPLEKAESEKRGWGWIDDDTGKMYSGPNYEIPDDIKDVEDGICKEILICEETGKPYKIIPQELRFCKMKGLPVPKVSPRQRHKSRMTLRNPLHLWERKCDKCNADIRTTYEPKRPEPVYCEKCYREEVY